MDDIKNDRRARDIYLYTLGVVTGAFILLGAVAIAICLMN